MSQPVHVIARHFARPESVEQVKEILLSLIPRSRTEEGCLKYELLQNEDAPAEFTFVETFASRDALAVHAAAPYIAGLQARLGDLVARPSEVSMYTVIG